MNGLTMRRLASQLGVQAMSLYHYVPSKAALLVLMVNRMVAALPGPDPYRPWQEQLLEMLPAAYYAGVGNPPVILVMAWAMQQPAGSGAGISSAGSKRSWQRRAYPNRCVPAPATN